MYNVNRPTGRPVYNVNGPTGGPVYNVGLQVGLCIM